MKTLIITLEYPPRIGGIATYVFNLVQHLNPAEVAVCAPPEKNSNIFDAKNPWKTYRVRPYYTIFWPRWMRLFWQVLKIVKQEEIEQIYLHHALPTGYIGYLMKKLYKIPYTIFFHGTDVELGNSYKRFQFKFVCEHADHLIVNSIFLKNKLLNSIPDLERIDLKVVYPCANEIFRSSVSADEIKRVKSALALEGKKVLLSVGRMDDGKGFPHLIRYLPKIVERVPNLVCLLVGEGPKKELLQEMVSKSGLQNIVRFVGNVPNDELPPIFQASDLFVLLCHKDLNKEEGWGTVFLEAAACGVPVIAGRAGGVEESVTNRVSGMVVDAYQENEVVNSIIGLLKDDSKRLAMGEAAKARTTEQLNWTKQIEKIYE